MREDLFKKALLETSKQLLGMAYATLGAFLIIGAMMSMFLGADDLSVTINLLMGSIAWVALTILGVNYKDASNA